MRRFSPGGPNPRKTKKLSNMQRPLRHTAALSGWLYIRLFSGLFFLPKSELPGTGVPPGNKTDTRKLEFPGRHSFIFVPFMDIYRSPPAGRALDIMRPGVVQRQASYSFAFAQLRFHGILNFLTDALGFLYSTGITRPLDPFPPRAGARRSDSWTRLPDRTSRFGRPSARSPLPHT